MGLFNFREKRRVSIVEDVIEKADQDLAQYNLPTYPPIQAYDEAKDRLIAAKTPEDAMAIVRAYLDPKVLTKGARPKTALDCLELDVPEWRNQITIVRDAYRFNRRSKRSGGWGDEPETTGISGTGMNAFSA